MNDVCFLFYERLFGYLYLGHFPVIRYSLLDFFCVQVSETCQICRYYLYFFFINYFLLRIFFFFFFFFVIDDEIALYLNSTPKYHLEIISIVEFSFYSIDSLFLLILQVILRCPKALHLLYVMGGRKGVKPLNEVAEDFLIMADNHPVFYAVPQV